MGAENNLWLTPCKEKVPCPVPDIICADLTGFQLSEEEIGEFPFAAGSRLDVEHMNEEFQVDHLSTSFSTLPAACWAPSPGPWMRRG